MKHSPLTLLERAAELYDFGSAMRAPGAPAEPAAVVPAADEAEAAPQPAPIRLQRALPDPVEESLEPLDTPDGVARIDRAALAEAGLVVPDGPVSGLAEEVRLIKRQLLAGIERRVSLPEEKRRSVLICSAQPNEGKSFCAVNLALSLAGERDCEVLLVDGDVTKPEAMAMLGLRGGAGLVDALADPSLDPERLIVRTDVPGLSLLPAGRRANDVPELLASDRTRALLARLVAAERRRIIIFDSPPALMASLAATLAAHVGQALIVVRADRTKEADLRETVALLSACDHISLILNGAALATGRRYGAYEGYGDEE